MKFYDARTSFAGGELAPELYGRVDLAQYQIGCRTLLNFIVLPQGAVVNRPGTARVGTWRYPSGMFAVRLVPFIFSAEDSCVLAFTGEGYVDRYVRSGAHERIWGSPYGRYHLDRLRWLQSADVLYLFHPDMPTYTLSRTPSGWEFHEVEFERGPFEDMNTDPDLKVEVYAGVGYIDGKLVDLLVADHDMDWLTLGVLLRIETEVPSSSKELTLNKGSDADTAGEWVVVQNVFGAFTYRTSGKWTGDIEVQRCKPDGWVGKDSAADWAWEGFKRHSSQSGAEENFSFSGDVEEYADHYRFRYKGGNDSVTVNFTFDGGAIDRVFRVLQVNGPRSAYVEDVDGKRGGIPLTDEWAMGSFGPHRGYPSMGIFHQERLVLAATRRSPQTIWMSQPASWHNFGTSIPAKDEDAITVTLASKEINEIRGLASRGDLLILTAGGEWSAKAGSKSDVFTPSSIVITPSGYRGSADIEPLDVGDVTLFVQRGGSVVRSLGYSLDIDGYSASDISVLASHILDRAPIKRWCYQQSPWGLVWGVQSSGAMVAVTLQKEHQVTAWTRQDLSGRVVDVCAIPGARHDDLYLAVERNGAVQIERLEEWGHSSYYDGGTTGGGTPVRSVLETLDLEGNMQGTLQGRFKHVPVVTLRLLRTRGLRCGIVNENNESAPRLDELQFPGRASPGPSPTLFSGDVRHEIPGGVSRTCRIRIENDRPDQVCLLALFPEVVVEDENIAD